MPNTRPTAHALAAAWRALRSGPRVGQGRLPVVTPQRWNAWGTLLVRRWPGAGHPGLDLEHQPQGLFLLWLAYVGGLLLGGTLLWQQGVWLRLFRADPTGLTGLIVVIFVTTTVWAGRRAWHLGVQWQAVQALGGGGLGPSEGAVSADQTSVRHSWAQHYLALRQCPDAEPSTAQQILSEQAHGPQETAWWLNGLLLKLGLLGKVIGFSVLALELGQMEAFDPQQSAQMLKSLTGGLAIALLTTIAGLSGNILLGLQLMRIDRLADAVVAHTLALGEQRVAQAAQRP